MIKVNSGILMINAKEVMGITIVPLVELAFWCKVFNWIYCYLLI